jgi:lysine biosynthesis protein LysW
LGVNTDIRRITMVENLKIKCPVCKKNFNLEEEPEEGDVVVCQNCDAKLEVESIKPIELVGASTENSDLLFEEEDEEEYGLEDEEMGSMGYEDYYDDKEDNI